MSAPVRPLEVPSGVIRRPGQASARAWTEPKPALTLRQGHAFLRKVKDVAFGPGWPLQWLLVGFPVWWALGMASFSFLVAAIAMAFEMVRHRRVRLPVGFGLWFLFLVWTALGACVLWASAPGTLDGGGAERMIGFVYRGAWYLAVTVAVLYPMSLSSRSLPTLRVARWLGALFICCVVGGLAGMLWPRFEFVSLVEMIVPGARGDGFLHQKLHPQLTTISEFLGYEQPRPKAPFTYANAWGNNIGLLLPFFIWAWLVVGSVRRRVVGVVVLLGAAVPVAFSLNRGLWAGLGILAAYGAFELVRRRNFAVLWAGGVAFVVAGLVFLASPLSDIVALRLETPHSNERRSSVAEVVISTTWEGSPLLGFGSNRQVIGSFSSVAGGETPGCHSCAAPPLGTQGLVWRLIFTTGFVGTALFTAFMALQLLRHVRRRDPESVLGCMTLALSVLFFFVYDSLESPLFLVMLAIGLMNRARLEDLARGPHPRQRQHGRRVPLQKGPDHSLPSRRPAS